MNEEKYVTGAWYGESGEYCEIERRERLVI